MLRILVYVIMLGLVSSCVTYDYTYESKETKNYIDTYKNPAKTKKYSISTYISVAGIPIGSSILLGNHAYNNAVNNGSPVDTASLDRSIIIGLGVATAALGTYYLVKDTSLPKSNYIASAEVKEWYANVVDFDDNIFLGSYRKGGNLHVMSISVEDTSKLFVESKVDFKNIIRNLKMSPHRTNLESILIRNSIDKIPDSQLYDVYELSSKKYPELLFKQLKTETDYLKIRKIVDEVKTLDIEDKSTYYDLASNKLLKLIDRKKLQDITNWLWTFDGITTPIINSTRDELTKLKAPLEEEKKKQEEEENRIYGSSKQTIMKIKKILEFFDSNAKNTCKIIFNENDNLKIKVKMGDKILFNDYFYNLKEENLFYYPNRKNNPYDRVDCFNVNFYHNLHITFKKGWTSFLGGYASTNDALKARAEYETFKNKYYSNYISYLETLGLTKSNYHSLNNLFFELSKRLIDENHYSSTNYINNSNLDKMDNYLLSYYLKSYSDNLPVNRILHLYKNGLISDHLFNDIKIKNHELKDLSQTLTDFIINDWNVSLTESHSGKKNYHGTNYINYTEMKMPNLLEYNKYNKINPDIFCLNSKITDLDKKVLVEYLSNLLGVRQKEALKERKLIIDKLEIGDWWQEGYIEQFNPNKTKVQVRINIDGKPDQLKWIDLK